MHIETKLRNSVVVYMSFVASMVVLVYWPGLYGGFLFDDYHSIVLNQKTHLEELTVDSIYQAAISGIKIGLLGRPISMVSFGLNYYFGALEPFGYKLFNITVHIINAVGIYFLTYLLLGKNESFGKLAPNTRLIALLIAVIWAVHPINVSSVLYVVQRMALLSAFFIIYGAWFYCWVRSRCELNNTKVLVSVLVLLSLCLLSVFSKENGVLFPLYLVVIETFFNFGRGNNLYQKRFLYLMGFVFILIPTCIGLSYLTFFSLPDSIFAAYGWRQFTLEERLLTEARVLFSYISWILVPSVQGLSFFHDNYVVSKSLFQPLTTIIAITSLFLLIVASIFGKKKFQTVGFGFIWFLASHSLESTILPLELVFEHRNYLASLGIIIAVVVYGTVIFTKFDRIKFGNALAIVFVCFLSITTFTRSSLWGNQFALLSSETKYNPMSARAYYELGRWYLSNADMNEADNIEKVSNYFRKTAEVKDDYIIGLVGLILLHHESEDQTEKTFWAQEIARRSALYKLDTTSPGALASLIQCRVNKAELCRIADKNIETIYSAVLANNQISKEMKAIFLSSYSKYHFIVKKDLYSGIELMRQAMEIDPHELEYKLQMADLLLFIEERDAAMAILNHVKKEDTLGVHSNKIHQLRKNIAAQELKIQAEESDE